VSEDRPELGLSPYETALRVREQIVLGSTYARRKKRSFRLFASSVQGISLFLAAASTVILGLQDLNLWAGLAFSLVAIITVINAIEPFFNWRSRWILMEEGQHRFYRLQDDLDSFLNKTEPEEEHGRAPVPASALREPPGRSGAVRVAGSGDLEGRLQMPGGRRHLRGSFAAGSGDGEAVQDVVRADRRVLQDAVGTGVVIPALQCRHHVPRIPDTGQGGCVASHPNSAVPARTLTASNGSTLTGTTKGPPSTYRDTWNSAECTSRQGFAGRHLRSGRRARAAR
jgi:hypothetical protein